MAEIIPESDPHAADATVSALRAGELVVYPTDTVYGLGALASNDQAVRRLFAAKGRPPTKALPLLIADSAQATWIAEVTPLAHSLMIAFWPGALTIVMRRLPDYRSLALAGEDTAALRVPDHGFVRGIIRILGEPLTGTSANRSGNRAPASAAEAALQLGDMVALVIDGGPCRQQVESTVIDTTSPEGPYVLREGAISRPEIERVAGVSVR
jgi:L-threonylcarbamoyladenylate synthase